MRVGRCCHLVEAKLNAMKPWPVIWTVSTSVEGGRGPWRQLMWISARRSTRWTAKWGGHCGELGGGHQLLLAMGLYKWPLGKTPTFYWITCIIALFFPTTPSSYCIGRQPRRVSALMIRARTKRLSAWPAESKKVCGQPRVVPYVSNLMWTTTNFHIHQELSWQLESVDNRFPAPTSFDIVRNASGKHGKNLISSPVDW